MEPYNNRRRYERAPYNEPLDFTVLATQHTQFSRIPASGTIVDASSAGIGLLSGFSLEPGHVLEWDDKHQKGRLHIALVKWAQQHGDQVRAGLMFI